MLILFGQFSFLDLHARPFEILNRHEIGNFGGLALQARLLYFFVVLILGCMFSFLDLYARPFEILNRHEIGNFGGLEKKSR